MDIQTEKMLRKLIREYGVRYNLPTTGMIGKENIALSNTTAFKTALAIIGTLLLVKGGIFVMEKKQELESFAKEAKDVWDFFKGTIGFANESASIQRIVRQIILEEDSAEKSLVTIYGTISITAGSLMKTLLSNIKTAKSKEVIALPTIEFSDAAGLKLITDQVYAKVNDILPKIVQIATDDASKVNFPNNFNNLGISMSRIDGINDLDSDEKIAAKKAMSDACATGLYNRLREDVMYKFIVPCHEAIEKIDNQSTKQECEKIFTDFVNNVSIFYNTTVTEDAKKILTPAK